MDLKEAVKAAAPHAKHAKMPHTRQRALSKEHATCRLAAAELGYALLPRAALPGLRGSSLQLKSVDGSRAECPHQALADRMPMAVWREAIVGRAVDMMDNASALPTCPQPQQQTQPLAA